MSRENKSYIIDGKEVWESRSIATALIIYRGEGENTEILAIKRGPAVNNTGKWSIPCGYLNWDESIYESACREAYEEAGIKIDTSDIKLIEIVDQYKTKKQNVVLYFITKYDGEGYNIPENILEFSKNEVSEIEWVKIYDKNQNKVQKIVKNFVKKHISI